MRKRRKKTTLMIAFISVAIVSIFSTFFGNTENPLSSMLQKKVSAIKKEKVEKEEKIEENNKKSKQIVGAIKSSSQKYGYDSRKVLEKLNSYDYSNNGEKIVFLTFNDGPSSNTPNILDILNKHQVKATFFITGKSLEDDDGAKILKQTLNEGHAIGYHTYSHNNSSLYPDGNLDIDSFIYDLKSSEKILKKTLGDNFFSNIIRCPGGYRNLNNTEELGEYFKKNNLVYIDWNALNADDQGKKKNAEELFQYAKQTSSGKEMVVLLMHDGSGKEETVKSLDKIINYYKDNGYEFKILI